MMPAFEGFDERAHFSSMRQIAATGTVPVLKKSYVDRAFAAYRGPRPSLNVFHPPYNEGLVYSTFFKNAELVSSYRPLYREEAFPSSFTPGTEYNWQAQHPPLYYLMMAPVVTFISGIPLVVQFFALRLLSYILALGGVFLGLMALPAAPVRKNEAFAGYLLYPFIFPMFFPEFARLGNDSFCLFLVGLLAFLLARWKRDEGNLKRSLGIGLVLGLGLLTKAFFMPLTVGLAAFLAYRLWKDKERDALWLRRRFNLLAMFYPALLMGGLWYVQRLSLGGDISGGIDSVLLAEKGGLLAGHLENFSVWGFLKGLFTTLTTFIWTGTQSLALVYWPLRLPLLALFLLVMGACGFLLSRRKPEDEAWLPAWLLAFLMAGFLYHIFVGLAINGVGQTPGWYLHILMPFTAPAVGAGLFALLRIRLLKPLVLGLVAYAFVFQAGALWSQFALFTGCAVKGDDMYYLFPNGAFCFDQARELFDRLGVLGYPRLAVWAFGAGILSAMAAFVLRAEKEDSESAA